MLDNGAVVTDLNIPSQLGKAGVKDHRVYPRVDIFGKTVRHQSWLFLCKNVLQNVLLVFIYLHVKKTNIKESNKLW